MLTGDRQMTDRRSKKSNNGSTLPLFGRTRSELLARERRAERGTERDVSGSYNNVFVSFKRVGTRTSLIVDPPNGRIPSLTSEAQKIVAAERELRLALLQATETCKNEEAACRGGKYDPTPSPRFADLPPRYNTARMNRNDGPEDSSLGERCLTGGLPVFGTNTGSFRRIVQTAGGISSNGTSLWMEGHICQPISASGMATRVGVGKAIPSFLT